MKVLVDLSMLRHPYCGLGQVALNYGRWLGAHPQPDFDVTLLLPKEYVGAFGDGVQYLPLRNHYRFLPVGHFDVWHSIHQLSPFHPSPDTIRILTIHDFNLLYYKTPAKRRRYQRLLQHECDSARKVCFISRFVADEAPRFLDLKGKEPIVIYNGVENLADGPQEPPQGWCSARPFFLSMGVVTEKKNLAALLPMMRLLPDYDLLIAGNDSSDYARRLRNEAGANVHLLGTVSDAERRWLYAHCTALLFPSLFEGFGLPVVEAMQFGKPVFCSTATSLPEVGGDVACYFQNWNPDNMAETVRQGLRDFTPEQAEGARRRAALFSYDRHMESYLGLYRAMGDADAQSLLSNER